MGLRATLSSTSSTNTSHTVIITESSLSTNASVHSNMAPALTEPLSQTNKLSSSASSASPRPTSNNLISSNNNISNSNHNNISADLNTSSVLANSNIDDTSCVVSSAFIGNKLNKDNYVTSKRGDFQLAFEKFQQAKRISNNFIAKANEKQQIVVNNIATDSYSSRKLSEVAASSVNGRLSDKQMGPMCDTNSSIVNFSDSTAEITEDQKEEIVETSLHMDYEDCDDDVVCEGSQDSSLIENDDDESQEPDGRVKEVMEEAQESQPEEGQEQQGPEHDEPMKTTSSDCDNTEFQTLDEIKLKSPPRTPTSVSNQVHQSQTTPTASLTPQSTTSGMGLQKDFIKDSAEMDQVLGELTTSDMDLLQVLKGFDTTPGGDGAFCELSLFTDVDVMNYEEVGIQQPKDVETKEVRSEIEKRQQQMQRKCDFLLRRLRKIQARFMGKHTTEEITGLFEWGANPALRRKGQDPTRPSLTYDEDKRRQISTASMKAFIRRIDTAATAQHTSLVKRNKVGRPSNASLQSEMSGSQNKATPTVPSVVPAINEKMTEEIAHVSGLLHTELKEVQSALDSEVTASSSGGESADEMISFNNSVQQPLSIAKRAAWKWARDRASIASRWTWLLAQISDLEYRIRQHNELHHQIKKNKGAVTFEKISATTSSSTTTTPISSPVLPSSVNGFRGVLPGNSKALDVDTTTSSSIPPNGAYESSTSNQSGSCRTRPFQRAGFRKRKLLQTANVHTVSKKAARPSTIKCGCQWPLHPCALCTGRSDPTAPRDLPDTMTPSERVALLDPGFHPVLSFPEDVSHSIHFEATMRLPEWQNRVIRCSTKSTLKGAVAVQKAAEREERSSKKYVDGGGSRRKYNRKYSQDIMAANKLKKAKSRRALHGGQYNNNHHTKSKHRKLVSSNSGHIGGGAGNASLGIGTTTGTIMSHGSSGATGGMSSTTSSTAGSDSMGLLLNDALDGINGLLPRSKNASPTPGCYSSSIYKNERMDRRNRNSYDIDNIVIPYSVAAATRVELLPYKEIPTPKWRVIDENSGAELKSKENETLEADVAANTDNGVEQLNKSEKTDELLTAVLEEPTEEDDEVEDISEVAIQNRHDRALMEERKKFQTYLKFPWSTRSRANRRIDSRAESSGANTPDPTSPAPNTPSVGGDQESIPSPAAPSTPHTPLDPMDTVENHILSNHNTIATPSNPPPSISSSSAARRAERKRTVSARKEREHSKDETGRSITPDLRENIPPYEPLDFPLPDDIYEIMLKLMPDDHQLLEDCLKSDIGDETDEKNENGGGSSSNNITTIVDSQALNATNSIGGGSVPSSSSSSLHNNTNAGGGGSDKNNTFSANSIHAFEIGDNLIGGDSDTDSAESGLVDEDPNDPEWREPTRN